MTDTSPAGPDGSGGSGYPSSPDCDPKLLDKLKCRAAGLKAQAEYATAHEAELTKARTDYDAARVAYRAARESAKPKCDDLAKQLDKL